MLLQNAPIVREWVGLRPTRKTVRIEQELMKFPSGNLQVPFYTFTEDTLQEDIEWGSH